MSASKTDQKAEKTEDDQMFEDIEPAEKELVTVFIAKGWPLLSNGLG